MSKYVIYGKGKFGMNVGERIRQLRKAMGLTLKDVSEKAGISISFLSDIENGRSQPSLERVKSVASILNTSVRYLMGEMDEPASQGDSFHITGLENVGFADTPMFKGAMG